VLDILIKSIIKQKLVYSRKYWSQVWCTPVIPAFRRLKQED
jgi:hypothetical protein